jgi:putative DNA primase/helicase
LEGTTASPSAAIHPTPPQTAEPVWENFPEQLTTRPQWVNWLYQFVPDRPRKPWTKVLKQPDGRPAKSNTPSTWTNFEAAQCGYYSPRDDWSFDGVGYVLTATDPFVAFDLDHCVNSETGEIEPRAAAYIDWLNSYTELSPSRQGIRVIVKATLPPQDRRLGNIEVYDCLRYVSVTGNVLPDLPLTIESRQEVVDSIHKAVFAKRIKQRERSQNTPSRPALNHLSLDDAAIVGLASQAKNGDKFVALYRNGDVSRYGDDHSRADFALISALLFWTNGDAAQTERIFSRSALAQRGKWLSRPDYRQMTMAAALQRVTEFYHPGKAPA